MALKVFEITRCWKNPRGRYIVAANSKTEAAKILGCSTYHISQYGYILEDDQPEYQLAMSTPKTAFKKFDDKSDYKPL